VKKLHKSIICVAIAAGIGVGLGLLQEQPNMLPPGQFAVVYSATTGRIRSVVIGSTQDLSSVKVGKGEAKIILDNGLYGDLPTLQSTVSLQTGLTPSNDRYAIVDPQGNVIGATIADPTIDPPPANDTFVQSDVAGPGWKYTNATFQAPTTTATSIQ